MEFKQFQTSMDAFHLKTDLLLNDDKSHNG